ncbi:hypothetical protein [uncultured Abiotrophia sp.]|uniref:hypothetical protein n=1 Tax=uncultured Abiotrophia sp. TaxID=316094 RepID=UPI0028D2842C|nr:hypothetical protein [uncultured Abiotrophia sp.]
MNDKQFDQESQPLSQYRKIFGRVEIYPKIKAIEPEDNSTKVGQDVPTKFHRKVKSLCDRITKIISIFIGVAIIAYLLSLVMIILVTYIPEAKFFLMDKDGYYNVTLIGTLIAGIALIVNTNELTRKAKEEQERYEKDRVNERERYNRETRRQLEKDRIDRLHRAFYNYYKTVNEIVEGFDEMIFWLKRAETLGSIVQTDDNAQLEMSKYIERFNEAQSMLRPAYKSKIWMAGRDLIWQINDRKSDNSACETSTGGVLKDRVIRVSEGLQEDKDFNVMEAGSCFSKPEKYIEAFEGPKKTIREHLKNLETIYQEYFKEELEGLKK